VRIHARTSRIDRSAFYALAITRIFVANCTHHIGHSMLRGFSGKKPDAPSSLGLTGMANLFYVNYLSKITDGPTVLVKTMLANCLSKITDGPTVLVMTMLANYLSKITDGPMVLVMTMLANSSRDLLR
jgi:hypothetical protein